MPKNIKNKDHAGNHPGIIFTSRKSQIIPTSKAIIPSPKLPFVLCIMFVYSIALKEFPSVIIAMLP